MWCLTGDKAETARSVAAACGLWEAALPARDWDGEGLFDDAESGSPLHLAGRSCEAIGLRLEAALLSAPAVLVSRCAPYHKAALVAFLRGRGRCVLAVGDGGNDVAMIQEADVGVGLAGREGTQVRLAIDICSFFFCNCALFISALSQAALAGDFALEQFADLRRLVLGEGRLALLRVSFVGLFCFYKSGLLALSQACFAAVSLFSGASLFSSAQLLLYNVAFTSAPLLSRLADRPPVFFVPAWNRALAGWLARAVLQAGTVFLVCVWAAGETENELNLLSLPIYCSTVLVATWTLLFEAHTLTAWLVLAVLVPPVLLFLSVFLLSLFSWTREYGAAMGGAQVAATLLATALCLLPVFCVRAMWVLRGSVAAHHYAKLSDNEADDL